MRARHCDGSGEPTSPAPVNVCPCVGHVLDPSRTLDEQTWYYKIRGTHTAVTGATRESWLSRKKGVRPYHHSHTLMTITSTDIPFCRNPRRTASLPPPLYGATSGSRSDSGSDSGSESGCPTGRPGPPHRPESLQLPRTDRWSAVEEAARARSPISGPQVAAAQDVCIEEWSDIWVRTVKGRKL